MRKGFCLREGGGEGGFFDADEEDRDGVRRELARDPATMALVRESSGMPGVGCCCWRCGRGGGARRRFCDERALAGVLCVEAGRAGRGGSGVKGCIPRRRGGAGKGGADEAETKVSFDEEEDGRRSFSDRTIGRGDSLSGPEDFSTYCIEGVRR